MPREIENHEQIIAAFRHVEILSQLVEQLPNGEYKNELDMDIILFGRSYRGKKVGPYARLMEYAPDEVIIRERTWESGIFYLLVRGPLEVSVTDKVGSRKVLGRVPEGKPFGEMALLAGTPRTATVAVPGGSEPAYVLEFTRPALRLLRKLPKFGKGLDRSYRDNGLALSVNELKTFSPTEIPPDVIKRLDEASRFAVYEKGYVLFREGDPINRVMYLRNGWIQRVSGVEFNPKNADLLLDTEESVGLDFLGAGSCLGLEAVETPGEWKYTATVRGRAEVVEIAVSRLREEQVLSTMVVPLLKGTSDADDAPHPARPSDRRALSATGREIDTGVVDGVNLLVMDMAKCVRCGNCSLACHKVHGHSRLVRRGIHIERPVKPGSSKIQSVLVPQVCMHCHDPECLTGCPTGAIARFPGGEIDIDPATCIGCGDCATQCPYNAISMIPLAEKGGGANGNGLIAGALSMFAVGEAPLPPPVTAVEGLLAVKCNLCKGTGLNPPGAKTAAYSCEENCPTGALLRVNPHEYFDEITGTIGLIQKSKTHAIGVNIHRRDVRATLWHIFGTLIAIVGGGLALALTYVFTQDSPLLAGSWITMRWVTGLTGLGAIVWVMLYPMRKQVYRRRAGALRYWMLSHIYLGVLAGLLLLIHGGRNSGGILTSMLLLSFDLVIATGIFGALCYLIVPRFMTRIEREPLLLEDLTARREELRAQLVRISEQTSNETLKELIRTKVRRHFLGLGYLFRQYIRREDLNSMLAEARAEFRNVGEGMERRHESRLMDAVESAATLRRIDALIYLHRMLKIWLAPHVVFTAVMLVLLLIHIIQVVYFNVR